MFISRADLGSNDSVAEKQREVVMSRELIICCSVLTSASNEPWIEKRGAHRHSSCLFSCTAPPSGRFRYPAHQNLGLLLQGGGSQLNAPGFLPWWEQTAAQHYCGINHLSGTDVLMPEYCLCRRSSMRYNHCSDSLFDHS